MLVVRTLESQLEITQYMYVKGPVFGRPIIWWLDNCCHKILFYYHQYYNLYVFCLHFMYLR